MSGGGGFGTQNLVLAMGVVSVCIAMVGLFASSEASILSANKLRLKQLADKGDKSAQAFCELREHEDKMFATILAVENMFIIFAASFGVASAERILGPGHQLSFWAMSIGTLTLIPFLLEFLIVLFGEITPKTYAARHSMAIALLVSRPLLLCINLLYPLIQYCFVLPSRALIRILDRIFGSRDPSPSITEEELRMMIDHSSQEGVLNHDERELLQNVFEFGDTVASEVMTPRTQLVAYAYDTPMSECLPEMLEEGFSQYLVYEESIDEIKGVVFLKDFFKESIQGKINENDTLERYIRPTIFVPENKKIFDLLEMMQTHRTKVAIVADEYGGTEGMVTIQDILSEIVGEMTDEHTQEEESDFRKLGPGSYAINGATSIYDINEELNLNLPEGKNYQTLAGFVLEQMGHIPSVGSQFQYQNWEITVTDVNGPKIVEVRLTRALTENEAHDSTD